MSTLNFPDDYIEGVTSPAGVALVEGLEALLQIACPGIRDASDLTDLEAQGRDVLAELEVQAGDSWPAVRLAVGLMGLHHRLADGDLVAAAQPGEGIAPYPVRPAKWLRVGDLRKAIANLPDDSPVQIECAHQEAPALYAFEQASDAAGICGTDPEFESTCGVLIVGSDASHPMATRTAVAS